MSLILDALNRADQERNEKNETPSLHSSTYAPSPLKHPIRRWILEAIVIASAVGFFFYYQYLSKSPATQPVQSTVQSTTPTVEPVKPMVNLKPALEKKPTVKAVQQNVAIQTTTIVASQDSAPSNNAINSLYQQQALVQSEPEKQDQSTSVNNSVTEQQPPSRPVEIPKADPVDLQLAIFQDMPLLAQMPKQFQRAVPSIEYSVHVYSQRDGAGFVTLNGKRRKVGELVAPGLVVIKILKDSLVLDFNGTQFRLLSLNSWVNFD